MDVTFPRFTCLEQPKQWNKADRDFSISMKKAARKTLPPQLREKIEEEEGEDLWDTANPGDSIPTTNDDRVEALWRAATGIQQEAALCSVESRNEDAWSDFVVLEILKAAMRWSGLGDRNQLFNV